MIDVACSAALLALTLLLAVTYGVRMALRGAAGNARVDKDGGSALLGKGAMSAGYWALEPLGGVLAGLGVTPNLITLGSLALGLVAAVALGLGHFGVAALIVTVATLGDALDGIVARRTGVASDAGEVVDASVDRYQEFTFLGAVAVYYRDHAGWLVLTLAALLGSVMTSYATAKAEALQTEVPRGSMRRAERAVYLTLGAAFTPFFAHFAAGRAAWVAQAPMLLVLVVVAVMANWAAVYRLAALVRALEAKRTPPPSGGPSKPAGESVARSLGKHQLGAVASTVADFGTMALAVELLHVSPVAATALGASCGALTNFTLARTWIFRGADGAVGSQALRYAVVSAASLGLNTLGEFVLAGRLGVQYFAARVVVAAAVSVLWNFPMHRQFVFQRSAGAAS